MKLPDVDIDLKDRDSVANLFEFTPASELNPEQTRLVKHKTGLHPQAVPVEPETGLCVFPYAHANDLDYYKIDLIPNHIYDEIESRDHLRELVAAPIDWNWFLDARFYVRDTPIGESLTHLGSYYDLVRKYPPGSIEDIAILLALLRPGKHDLIGLAWDKIKEMIWQPTSSGATKAYVFKKPHAFSFALMVTVHAKLIAEKLARS